MTSTDSECSIEILPTISSGGVRCYTGVCRPCGVSVMAATRADARARWDHHRAVPAPPASVLAEPVTRDLVDDWADWFLNGRGYLQASTTRCAHGRRLTEFCDTCD